MYSEIDTMKRFPDELILFYQFIGKLVTEEESEEGAISFKVVKRFWKSFGNVFATIVIFTKICEQGRTYKSFG